MLVTAFGPFGPFKKNPSEDLAKFVFGSAVTILPVSFDAVDKFIAGFQKDEHRLLMLGVSGSSTNLRIERRATDEIGDISDVGGFTRQAPKTEFVEGTLLSLKESCLWDISEDAGNYLCNYLYFQACKKLSGVSCAFIHVPTFCRVRIELQAVRLKRLISTITSA